MPLLKQDIRSSSRSGKTTMLLSLAAGYVVQGVPGVIVAANDQAAHEFRHRHSPAFEVWGPNQLVRYLKCPKKPDDYRVFLLDDAERMQSHEGHPVALLEHHFKDTSDYIVVIPFYADEQAKSPILMSRENPNGWKLESLTEKLREEINRKSLNIASDQSFEAQIVTNNNFQIIGLLMQIEALQRDSMVIMSQIGPDQGPTGRARLG
ncbi:hypothetical protein ACXHQB_23800 [Vibrio parahaemolyticus]|uniref:hypothetical protein n=1 Tax=Vibrio parahaemolyticus TaxID=670 RepID=UPI001D15F215|nr:hypothetical protein [Vibrio parahaemolyticus]MCC3798243.1 hypothetical protein [Vibrio parahaemolyticus]